MAASSPSSSSVAQAAEAEQQQQSQQQPQLALKGISLSFEAGQLSLLIGAVGSGKSTLLLCMLREAAIMAGGSIAFIGGNGASSSSSSAAALSSSTASAAAGAAGALSSSSSPAPPAPSDIPSDISFAPQTPWLMSGSIRQNICFDNAFDASLYSRVLHACCLEEDLQRMKQGDETPVTGSSLSGGQRARVSLARSLYTGLLQGKSIFLLDDILAPLDARVSRRVFERCLSNKGLLAGKTRVLATHHLALLRSSSVSNVSVLEEGKLILSGTPAALFRQLELAELQTVGRGLEDRDMYPVLHHPQQDGLSHHAFPSSSSAASASSSFSASSTGAVAAGFPDNLRIVAGQEGASGSAAGGAAGMPALLSVSSFTSSPASPSLDTGLSLESGLEASARASMSLALIHGRGSGRYHSLADSYGNGQAEAILQLSPALMELLKGVLVAERRGRGRRASSAVSGTGTGSSTGLGLSIAASGSQEAMVAGGLVMGTGAGVAAAGLQVAAAVEEAADETAEDGEAAGVTVEGEVLSLADTPVAGAEAAAPTAAVAVTASVPASAAGAAAASPSAPSSAPPPAAPVRKSIGGESVATGTVSAAVYLRYFSSYGTYLSFIIIMLLVFGGAALVQLTAVWLSYFSAAGSNAGSIPGQYGAFVGVSVLVSVLRAVVFFVYSVSAARAIHSQAFSSVLRSKLAFLEGRGSGQILNRFTKDQTLVDDTLPMTVFDLLNNASLLLAGVVLICVLNPFLLLLLLPMGVVFYYLQRYYISSNREIKRLDAASKSAPLQVVSEALLGLTSIRCTPGGKQLVLKRFLTALDSTQRSYFAFLATSRWFGLQLDLLSLSLVAVTCFATTALSVNGSLSANLLGLSISSVMTVTGAFQWTVRQKAEMENLMVSPERLYEYCDLPESLRERVDTEGTVLRRLQQMQQEQAVPVGAAAPTAVHPSASASPALLHNWPSKGDICFRDVWLQYNSPGPFALRGFSTQPIQGGTRVALLGRTGAGKSSILLALLRMFEPVCASEKERKQLSLLGPAELLQYQAPERKDSSGSTAPSSSSSPSSPSAASAPSPMGCGITIDGVDISSLHLAQLRSSIGYIPQQPYVFEGTVRSNLDPFHTSTEADMWRVLSVVQLKEYVQQRGGLDMPVEAAGSNLSFGQRFLLTTARALLKKCAVMVIDEAVGNNLDERTDSILCDLIANGSEAFAKETVIITISHRISSIISYDRVIVMENGAAVAEGHPYLLLQGQEDSHPFRSLVLQLGTQEAERLMAEAEKSYNRKAGGAAY